MFSQDSRRSSISDGSNSCSTYTYRASRRISSLFAYYDVLVQETSGADESSHTASKDSSALGKEHSPTIKAAVANNNNSRRQSFSAIGRFLEFFASLGLEEEEINDDSSTTSSEGKKSLDDAEHQASYICRPIVLCLRPGHQVVSSPWSSSCIELMDIHTNELSR